MKSTLLPPQVKIHFCAVPAFKPASCECWYNKCMKQKQVSFYNSVIPPPSPCQSFTSMQLAAAFLPKLCAYSIWTNQSWNNPSELKLTTLFSFVCWKCIIYWLMILESDYLPVNALLVCFVRYPIGGQQGARETQVGEVLQTFDITASSRTTGNPCVVVLELTVVVE